MLKIPMILSADKLIDKAFKKTKKIQVADRNPFYKKKKTIIAKTESFSTVITSTLERYVKKFPSIENMPVFYQEILRIKVDIDKTKKALGAVDWACKTCKNIYSKQIKSMRISHNLIFLKQKQKEIYGRISSVVKQINNELKILEKAQRILTELPEIQDLPTVVIAGYPNVGKSSLLRCLSSAKPEIAQYPFTTKQITIGHLKLKNRYLSTVFQVIDTPGLLDRPLPQKNEIEKQAIAALSSLADIIVFILDPSESCGYSMNSQMKLLKQLKEMFKESEFIVVENKSDVKKTKSNRLKISCETGEGVDLLVDKIVSVYKNSK